MFNAQIVKIGVIMMSKAIVNIAKTPALTKKIVFFIYFNNSLSFKENSIPDIESQRKLRHPFASTSYTGCASSEIFRFFCVSD